MKFNFKEVIVMDFKFLLDINLLTFLLVFVIFGIWELVKYIYRKKTSKEIDPRVITTTNGVISIVYATLVVAAGLSINVFEVIVKAAAVFACGSLFDLLKAYGAIYKKE